MVAGLLLASPPWLASPAAFAGEGTVSINQDLALAGGLSAGDTPGFPVTIDQPGSYRLTGNLSVPDADTDGVLITAGGVTLDLNGFSISGKTICEGDPVSCSPTGNGRGVFASPLVDNVTVKDGVVRGMGNVGVFVGNRSRVHGVRAHDNGTSGIVVGLDSSVVGNAAFFNGAVGMSSSGGSRFEGNTARRNGAGGIAAGPGSTLAGNTASQNEGVGFLVGAGSMLVGNHARFNDDVGLRAESGVGYVHNVLTLNNGGNANPQQDGGIQIGVNVCGNDPCSGLVPSSP